MKIFHGLLSIYICALTMGALTCPAQTMVPWLTRSADNSRSGWNSHETKLSQAAVETKGIVRATIIPLVGDARGMEAQPLILPHVHTSKGIRDVQVLPSMANVIRGVDAHDGSGIWKVTLGKPVNGSKDIDNFQINQHWGCISTGVIDPDNQRLYQTCWIAQDTQGTPQHGRYFMFVRRMKDGKQVVPPVLIQGTSGSQDFNATMRKQRSSLVETNVHGVKTVFGCSGTIKETQAHLASGFCFAFDVATNKMSAMLAMTAGEGAGIWMAGQGAAADADGNLYVLTGNGDFDGVSQWGESFLKLKYAPPSGGNVGKLEVVDHWTPWTDFQRTGQAPKLADKLAGMSAPSEALRPVNSGMNVSLANARREEGVNDRGEKTLLVFPDMAKGNWSDEDWGSAGPACIFAIKVCIATGKDGIGYPISTDNAGGTTPADLADPHKNCQKLAAPPMWLTMSPASLIRR
jgi:hypothetical protein